MESGTKDLRPEEQGGGEGGYQPSFAQHRMWFLDRLAGGRSAEYIASPMWFVHGSLERPELERALERLLGRHAALRTRFVERDGAPHALVAEQSPVRIDWREAADAAEVARQAEEVAGRPFDLATGPLLRIVVWRLSATEHVLLAAVHHIVSDGWSLDVLVRELGALYDGRELPELEWEYADFAERQRRDLDGAALAHGLGYWRERLSGLPALELPTDRPRPTEPSWTGATREFTLAPELVARLEQVGRAHGATLYMTLLAAYQTVLGRWSGQRDFGIGVPVAGRGHSEVEHLIGLFVNTLVMRAELTGDPTFAELLTRVRDHTLDALDHQDVPYERIVRELRPERPDTDSLIDTWFAMQNLPVEDAEADRSPGALRFTDFGTDRPRALFALSLFAQPRADGVAMTFVYRTDLFDAATIDRLVRRCQALLAAVADQPDQPVNTLGLPAEELRELRELGSGDIPAPARDTITQFEDQVRRTPDAVALRTAGTTLTYAELNTRANRLAWWLTDQGVRTEIPVAVRLPRGPEMLIAVLGILKAGGAYVPIDPAWPAERVEHIRTDAGAHLLLDGPLPAADRDDNPQHAVHEQQLAYLIYTSGSTGTPKGVAIPRANLAAHTTRIRRRFALGPTDRVLQFAALAFDASIDQIFPALTCGASLVLPEHGLITPARLITDLHRHGVTLANLPPAYFRELIGALAEHESGAPDSLRLMVLGGDVVRPGEARAWTERYPDVELLNAYGPTEATVTTTLFEITPDSADRPDGIPIGRPLGDRHLHLLDHHLNPAPRGAIAELHIAGTQLARGYHGQPAHTADHFRPDPHGEPGTRIYRTGDLTRWTTDGHLTYHGRTDHQIKIRGYRIETGEIETRLREHPHIHDTVVITAGDRLIAYLVTDGTTAGIRDWLAERLPDYLVPSAFIPLDEIPRTVGGKTDRARLPDPDDHRPEPAAAHEPPRNPTEQAIAQVWQEVLQLDRIGIHDNFFDLGGHSLLATLAVARLTKALERPVDVRHFFERPTIAEFAAALPAAPARPAAPMARMVRSGDFPLSFAQEGLWFLHRLAPEAPDYLAALAWRVEGELDRARLDRALGQLAARHESLRTTFPLVDTQPVQRVAATADLAVAWHDLRGLGDPYGEAVRRAETELHRPFDLAAGPLVRVTAWQLDSEDHLLVLALHHIVSDGWSLGVLVRELGALYDGRTLPELPVQYADFANWQRQELTGARLERGLGYWRERLAALPALELPTDRPRPAEPSWAGATREFTLDTDLVARLEQVSRAHGASLYMTLLAAFQVALGQWSGQRDFGIGVPVAGRGRPEVEHLIGLFINTLVLRADLTGGPTFAELLTRVRDHTLDALDHQDVPFDRVVEELRPDRGLDRSPLFQAMFDLEVRSIGAPRLGSARLHPAEIPFGVTKFDLMFTFTTDPGAAGGFVQYRTDLFDAATIDRLVRRCQALLAAVADRPDQPVNELGLPAEELRELRELGSGDVPAPARDTIAQFEDQVRRTPDAVAVRTADTTLTYAELNTRANRLAWWLTDQGVRTEIPVAVRLPRGPEMLIAVLGILKAGGAYVPIDPAWPAERVEHIRTDAGAHLLLDGPLPAADRDENPQHQYHEQQLAYLIYTSGSTGTPKGVAIPRANLAAHTIRVRRRFALGPTDRVLQFAALAFDASVEQIFPALTCGASLVLPEHGLIAPDRLLDELEQHGVTVLEVVPGYLTELIAELSAPDSRHARWKPAPLRLLVLGGDVVRPTDLAWWTERFPEPTVLNTYGPTEATVTTTLFEITPDSTRRPDGIPIGRPLGDRHLHLLDHHLNPTPHGAIAELHIAGTQLARGYHHQPAHTADHFRPDPHGEPGTRIYRTGDLTRWTTDGHLTYHGRTDHQLKIRGYRIETGEIETRLREHPHIHDALVIAHQDRLIAYLATDTGGTPEGLRDRLAERLPDYLVPAVFIPLTELPRTVGGKTDRARLPDPDDHRPEPAGEHQPPRNPTEQAIAQVWQEVLQLDRIGIHDNFFDLGGHSLLATRVAIRMRTAFGCDIGVRALFERPTVARFATAVEEQLIREIAAMSGEDVAEALKTEAPKGEQR